MHLRRDRCLPPTGGVEGWPAAYSADSDLSPPAAKEKGEKKLLGFAFACLMDAEGATIRDGSHELCVYKCDDRHKLLVGVRTGYAQSGHC